MATDAELYAQAMGDTSGVTATGLGGLLGNLFSSDGISNAISGISGIYGLEEQQDLARQLGPTVQAQAEDLAARAGTASRFEPFTITSTPGLGGVQMGPSGVTLQPGQGAETLTSTALGGAQGILEGLLAPRADREAAILEQIEAARAPQRQREALAEEQRLLAQGRIGTQSAMFGGATPETLARMQAIEEQRSKDVLAAMNQAGTEQTQQEALLKSILGTAYTPQTQALGLLQAGVDPAKLAQSGQLAAGEALTAAIPYVTQATIAGEQTAADYTTPLLQAYTGLFGPAIQATGQAVGAQDIATQIGSAVQGGVTDLYNRIFG